MTATEFYNKQVGKAVDIDYTAGVQCVDLFKIFTKTNYGVWQYTCGNGYANGLWLNRKSKPYYQYFDEVNINSLQDGDWCFWDKGSKDCPDSHVAMYYQGKFFGQNQNGVKSATLANISKDGMLGALRPKMYQNNDNNNVVSYDDYYNERVKDYHWFPAGPFTEVDKNGNTTKDQVLGGGLSYVKNDNIYTVQDIDVPTNSAKLNIDGRDVWVFSKYLYEVSNN